MKLYKLITACLVFSSCTNLDEKLKDQWTGSDFGNTPTELNALLAAPYQTLYSFGGNNGYFDMQCLSTDELLLPQRGGDWYDGGVHIAMHDHTWNSSNQSLNVWINIYGGISACNRLLALPSVTSNAAAVAELRVLRAYFYWVLMDLYGNVPIVTTLGESVAQSTPSQVYSFIESEITTNADLLPKKNDASVYGRLTYYGAQAILAKMYLNAAVYTGTPQWQKAINACDLIINSGLFNLEANYESSFSRNNNGSKEHIFIVPFDHIYGQGFNLPCMTLHYSSQITYTMNTQPWNGYCSIEDFYNSYNDADSRKEANFLVGTQYAADGVTPITDPSYEKDNPAPNDPKAMADPDGATVTFTPIVNEVAPNALRQAGVRIGKFGFYQGQSQNLDNDLPLYRYADILLTKAEALYRLAGAGNTGTWSSSGVALMLVNQVHQRAGLPAYTSMTGEEFLAERGREMFYEGWRRPDLLRFGKFNDGDRFRPHDADNHVNIYPIPASQITATAGTPGALRQNPGYSN
jgi:hypothetical protein